MRIEYVAYEVGDAESLVELLVGNGWPFHSGPPLDRENALQRAADANGDESEGHWIVLDGERVGFVRLFDLDDDTPLFDLRLAETARGRGIGGHAVTWLNRHLFTGRPHVTRIEATTRVDNHAMRAVLRRCGYVKEAHYRDGWPDADGTVHDAVGYAVLRRDWLTGTVTPVPADGP